MDESKKSHSEADLIKAKQLRNLAKTIVRRAKAKYIQEEIGGKNDHKKPANLGNY